MLKSRSGGSPSAPSTGCHCCQRPSPWLLIPWLAYTRPVDSELIESSSRSRRLSTSCCIVDGWRQKDLRVRVRVWRTRSPVGTFTCWTLHSTSRLACTAMEQSFTSAWLSFHLIAESSAWPHSEQGAATACVLHKASDLAAL